MEWGVDMFVIELRRAVGTALAAAAFVALFLVGQVLFGPSLQELQAVTVPRTVRRLPLFRIPTEEHLVVLTLDVNWGDEIALQAARQLSRMEVGATFFVSGHWARTHHAAVAELAELGHDVASLGSTTADYRELSAPEIRHEFELAHGVLQNLLAPPGFVRLPDGHYDVEVLAAAHSLGYRLVLWDVESLDHQLESPAAVVQHVSAVVRPGSIVHFHADDSYPQLLQVLPALVRELRGADYTICPLTEALGRH
jgi:peptidoglycan/xylan/chitin deacetylase (PgdA/CDA1 family)